MHSFQELALLFEERFSSQLPFPAQPSTLYEPCDYFSRLGGKRVRPVLCLMANELYDNINADAWQGAFAVELFHNFSLIHDDIMDRAPLRRGKATIHEKYGLTTGILSGDVMNIYAYDSLAKINTNLKPILELFNRTAIQVCEGQQMDMDFEMTEVVPMDQYLEMITLKTSVLLACSLKIGALTAGALGNNADKLYEFGKNLGIAFQLQDDFLDAFGDPSKSGKQLGGDIIANKKTFLSITARQTATPSQQKAMVGLNQAGAADDKVAEMLQLFIATGADEACRKAVFHYSQLAFNSLEAVAIPSKRKENILQLAKFLLQREN